jgi:hypothetical protein
MSSVPRTFLSVSTDFQTADSPEAQDFLTTVPTKPYGYIDRLVHHLGVLPNLEDHPVPVGTARPGSNTIR